MVNGFYAFAKKTLSENGFDDANFEARLIAMHAFGVTQNQLLLKTAVCDDEEKLKNAHDMLMRRINHEPLQYILGTWQFFGLDFSVGKGVLIPRADTEILVETALEIIGNKSLKVVDLCSGSGCIAVAINKNTQCDVTAVELSDDALDYLKVNCQINNANVKIIKGDVLDENFAAGFDAVDVIVSNPPYLDYDDMKNLQEEVKHEPQMALFGGDDGLEYYRQITKIWKKNLDIGGYIIFEVGINQSGDVAKILAENGFESIKCVNDLNGIKRVVCAEYKNDMKGI